MTSLKKQHRDDSIFHTKRKVESNKVVLKLKSQNTASIINPLENILFKKISIFIKTVLINVGTQFVIEKMDIICIMAVLKQVAGDKF